MHRLLLVLPAVLLPTSLVGQRLATVPASVTLSLVASPQARRVERLELDTVKVYPRTYWLEGGVIAAVTTGVLGALWLREASDTRPSVGATVAVGALSVAVGFAPGALIGSLFHK